MNNRTSQWSTYALIVVATLVAYWPAIQGGMLWDDSGHVTRADLRSLHGLWRIWSEPGATQQYYPLLHSAFWLEHLLWGDSVTGYHLLNILLHALAACLVVRIVRRLQLPGAWLAGLLFALHPLCAEAVAWISEQKSTLSGVFYLAAALVYLRFDESRKRADYVAASGLFVAALLSKTVTAVLPAVLLVILWWRHGRLEWKRDARPLTPWFALGTCAGLFTAWMESTAIGASGAEFALSPVQRVLLAGRAMWFYAGKVLWPAHLTFFYPRWKLDLSEWWQWLFPAAAIGVAIALWLLRHRWRGPLATFLIFTGTLFPVLGFLNVYPFRYSYVADHFAYLACLALVIPIASQIHVGNGAATARERWGTVSIALTLVALFAVLTWQQSAIYRNEETLYRATLARNTGAWLAHNNLANLLLAAGKQSEAIDHLQAALRLNPDFPEAHLSLGNVLLDMPDRLNDALAEYQTAVRLAPNSDRAHTNLGNALLRAGRLSEAIPQLQEALRLYPSNAEAHNDLGNAFSQIAGSADDAIAQYRQALDLNPDFAEAHNNLGRTLAQSGRLPEAIAQFEAAVRAKPDSWSAHSNLGNALSMMPGRLDDAVAEYRAALRIRPDFPAAHNNLGNALARTPGRLDDAVIEYREALRLDPGFENARTNLAAALQRLQGRK
jgi:tetratricopeptide (TPR) repeat protein